MKKIIILAVILCTATWAQAQKISAEEAKEDLDSLLVFLTEIHPNPFFSYSEEEFNREYCALRSSWKDSIEITRFYQDTAPLWAKLGDGHTALYTPQKLIRQHFDFLPLPVTIDSNAPFLFVAQDCTIEGVEFARMTKIVSINGILSQEIIENLIRYHPGEKMFFRLSMTNRTFPYLFALDFPSEIYRIQLEDGRTVTLQALPYADCALLNAKQAAGEPYSFYVTENGNAVVMDFKSFSREDKFRAFADSMFRTCQENKIRHLIIDLRENGGGNSNLGDELLYHLTGETFQQGSSCLVNNTPRIRRLLPYPEMVNYLSGLPDGVFWTPEPTAKRAPDNYIPFDGNVYILISHLSFSSAVSFAWTMKELGIGTFIGEETGGMGVCFGNVLHGVLPHSGLQWQTSFAKMYMWNAAEEDTHGVLPDIEIPADQALDYVLNKIGKN